MKKIIFFATLTLSLILFMTACKQKEPAFNEEIFIGDWYTIKGDVEGYSFLRDDSSFIFTGFMGMRPVIYGSWKIEKDKFVITMDNGTTTAYSFRLLNDTLVFNEGQEIYTRTVPLEVQFPETRILISLISDLGLNFSEPRPVDISWGTWIDSTQTSQDFIIKGYSISVGSTLSSDDMKDISGHLEVYGFEIDTIYVTEICNGYWKDNQLVTVCTSQYPDAVNDSVYIHVASGLVTK